MSLTELQSCQIGSNPMNPEYEIMSPHPLHERKGRLQGPDNRLNLNQRFLISMTFLNLKSLHHMNLTDLRQEVYVFAGVYLFVCLFVCVQHNSKSYGSILMKFSGINCYIKIWKWFIFERSRSKVKVKIDQKVKFT